MVATLSELQTLANTFCNSGQKTATIPVSATGTNAISLEEGFPLLTSTDVLQGGIPPKRLDMNAILGLLSEYCYYLQNGGTFTYNADVATAIGGYPSGAVLDYFDGNNVIKIISLVENNTNEPNGVNIKYANSGAGTYYWQCATLDTGLRNLSDGLERTICDTPATTTSTATAQKPAVIVKNYYNSSTKEWYRIWSDGWCEQGGYKLTNGAYNWSTTINFLVSFADTSYSMTSAIDGAASGYGASFTGGTKTSITVYSTGWGSISGSPFYSVYWRASGYCTGQVMEKIFEQTSIGNGASIVNEQYTKTFTDNAVLSIQLGGGCETGNGGELRSTIQVQNGDTIKAVSINGHQNGSNGYGGVGVGILLNNTPILYAGGGARGYTGGSGYKAGLKSGGVSGNTGYDYNGTQTLTYNDWSTYMTTGTACGAPYHTSNGTACGGDGYIASAYSADTTYTNASNTLGAYIKIYQYL